MCCTQPSPKSRPLLLGNHPPLPPCQPREGGEGLPPVRSILTSPHLLPAPHGQRHLACQGVATFISPQLPGSAGLQTCPGPELLTALCLCFSTKVVRVALELLGPLLGPHYTPPLSSPRVSREAQFAASPLLPSLVALQPPLTSAPGSGGPSVDQVHSGMSWKYP